MDTKKPKSDTATTGRMLLRTRIYIPHNVWDILIKAYDKKDLREICQTAALTEFSQRAAKLQTALKIKDTEL